MFHSAEISRAVDLQQRSYELLKWVASAIDKGFISFKAAHSYSSITSAAEEWVGRHYMNIPESAKPSLEDLKDFCGLFSTYLENSFELVRNPGKRLFSPDAHCFCPLCSWLVDVPHLKIRTPATSDKKRARKMMLDELTRLAAEHQVWLTETKANCIVDDNNLREQLALTAYGSDLFHRMHGVAVGPAALVLWRNFAWLPSGSPKKKFKLSAELIIKSEQVLSDRVLCDAS